ncbi:MAG TPA: response regulator transcription factor [Ferruginibacter sp.]|nr:response regulator transcription factor [Ferruginibacter sp.]HNJ28623.1 response regulator transcription factor [Ferruginibacter sp.]HNJ94796.1 response regulator transcription factor [Ferruginibacter sp.]HNN71870.1 response regulator transcription factor [Ferruginibacter sp.]
MNNEPTISVVIFEDNAALRDSLALLLQNSSGIELKAVYADATRLQSRMEQTMPDVVLMDIQMPGINGIEAVQIIKEKFPGVQVMMQTVFDSDDKVFASLCAGASGYILKNTEPARVIQAIREVAGGGSFFTPSIAKKVLQSFQQPANTGYVQLTAREKEVLQGLVDGASYKMIAARLDIRFGTVHTHVKNIYEKLHVNSASEAVVKAIRQRLV